MPATRFRKRPVEIDAVRWDGTNWDEVCDFLGVPENGHGDEETLRADPSRMPVLIHTLEGDMRAELGDWIIRGVKGEHYPCKPDIFAATYELVAVPTAVFDAHDESWWGLTQDDRQRFADWLTGQGYAYDGRAVYRTEIHDGEQPHARVFAFALDEQGRKYRDPTTGDAAQVPPVDVPLTSLPPVQPAEVV